MIRLGALRNLKVDDTWRLLELRNYLLAVAGLIVLLLRILGAIGSQDPIEPLAPRSSEATSTSYCTPQEEEGQPF